ncbi:MAG: GDP-L-fucose synthase family protein [bacterium]
MNTNSKIYLAGHRGLVGSAIQRKLEERGYTNIITRTSKDLDLRDQKAVNAFFEQEKPEYVILAAAKVGGILANNKYRAEFIYDNIQIQNNIIHNSYMHGVKKLMFLGSSCIYPKNCPQPMKEDHLLTDELEYTNEPYAVAKIAGMKMCESYNIQYGTNFISVMPTNLYGPNDNYDLEKSHVLPALIRKMHLGKCLENNDWESIRIDINKNPIGEISGNSQEEEILKTLKKQGIESTNPPINQSTNSPSRSVSPSSNRSSAPSFHRSVIINLWGSGNPRREFLHANDMADACIYLVENINFADLVEYSIPKEKQTKEVKNLLHQAEKENSTEPQNNKSVHPFFSLVNDHKIQVRNTHINIGTGRDISIKDLAELIKNIVGYKGNINWNTEMPDGTYQKLLDVSKLNNLGWKEKISLEQGIREVYEHYLRS